MRPVTIGITTRNRPEALRRCVTSIATVLPDAPQVLVFDDNSDVPADEQLAGCSCPNVRVIRDVGGIGPIAGRNVLVQEAEHDLVLLLDDDAALLQAAAIEEGVNVVDRDPRVAAVAFAQAERDGRPWPERMQAGRGDGPALVPAYIGFANIIRRSAFLAVGGYRSTLVYYGEEKELCLRLMEAGYFVVYLPGAAVAHIADPGGRDARRYVRHVIRNDCLTSLYNEPWPLVAISLPVRLLRYRRMAAAIDGGDPGGLAWILRALRDSWRGVMRDRRAVSWATIRRWRRLGRTIVPYRLPGTQAEG